MSYSRSKCLECGAPPTIDIRWAEGIARAWFCAKCYAAWKKKHPGEVNVEHKVQGEVPVKWADRPPKPKGKAKSR